MFLQILILSISIVTSLIIIGNSSYTIHQMLFNYPNGKCTLVEIEHKQCVTNTEKLSIWNVLISLEKKLYTGIINCGVNCDKCDNDYEINKEYNCWKQYGDAYFLSTENTKRSIDTFLFISSGMVCYGILLLLFTGCIGLYMKRNKYTSV